ncbi:MAG: AAA domain-containing protein [Moorellaceae bacterium]
MTAYAPKALAVLRDLLPGDIPNLCVMAFGSTREDQKLLEDSIRRILSRKNEWDPEWAQQEITKLEEELSKLEETRARLDGQLCQCREAETYSHTLFGGYQGTTAQIARQVELDEEAYSWFPDVVNPESRCPLEDQELKFLAEVHGWLTEEHLRELRLEVGEFSLPDPEEFHKVMEELSSSEERWQALAGAGEPGKLNRLQDFPDATLENCKMFLYDLQRGIIRARRILGGAFEQIFSDLLLEQSLQWQKFIQDRDPLLAQIKGFCEKVGTARIEVPEGIERTKLLGDGRRRLEHFKRGGRRGFGILAPKVVRETRYIEEKCWVDSQSPREPEALQILVTYLELEEYIQQLRNTLPELADLMNQPDPRVAAQTAEEFFHEISRLLSLFEERGQQALKSIPLHERALLVEPSEIQKWLVLLEAEMARRSLEKLKEVPETWLIKIRALPEGNLHRCVHELARAVAERDAARWKAAWEERERFREEKRDFRRYQELSQRLEQECPGLKSLLDSSRGRPEWRDRILQLGQAWAWAAARAWLRLVTDVYSYRAIVEQRRDVEDKIKKTVLRLVELKAWKAFFDRLDEKTKQSLVAWQKAMDRVGQGTGKYAFKHRRAARSYLLNCIQKIPIWVMPIHKLWDTVTAEPGMFDTIIIDEASQAGLDSLVLLLLGKRVVVVGDDKQNSPEAVGVPEEDIARLAREYLRDFRFREEFRPDASLYDHAERAFGNVISLREHFRCVPEIIRFSNDLCYTDSPLIPLRQPPPDRLPPLKATYVSGGFCEGEGQRLINLPEADEIVKTIRKCIADEAYQGKTMGVIVLQGHAQAELIERKLAEVLEPKERAERKLRCGVPATFQGDQRDVIFLSLVVAPNHSYRALTSLADRRRFNVAMSRARDQVWLFHSVHQHELSREDLRWRLLNFFYGPGQGILEGVYEERERLEREARKRPRQPGTQPEPYESWFEVDVALELLRRGYRVKPQFEVSGYRIDLVVEGLENRLAVECDGDAWHGPEQFERDMARQRQLERAGWNFVRIRESEFYADRRRALQLVEEKCAELNIYPAV